ncbi:MAG: exopolysaccharide Pel transporter PelG [Candidatus Omnitrophica bacterium]|nr:exopolysaccharide Pel transporter PelG [Candidatus Omnitrophota bacterium]
MAGIGFRIEKILEGDTYIDFIKAHFYSALVFSGPWIISIVTIFLLSYFRPSNMDMFEMVYFNTVIVYIFAFSLIVAGFFFLSLSRYLADRLYLKEGDMLSPAFNSSALSLLMVQAFIGIAFFAAAEGPALRKFLIVMIYLAISLLWHIMIFLSTLKDYKAIGIAFLSGSFIIVAGSVGLGRLSGLNGYFAGYLAGSIVIVGMLSTRVFVELGSRKSFDINIFSFLRNNYVLVLIGIFYNAAIWIDKIVLWLSPQALKVASFLRSYPLYEHPVFIAYLTIIPSLSFFLVHVETHFYKKYKAFYIQVLDKGSYSVIRQAKREMVETLRNGLTVVMIYQGVITLLAVTFAYDIAGYLHLQAAQIPVFRITVLGAYLHALLLISIITILYFDFKGIALAVSFFFLLTNGLFTFITMMLKTTFLGYGYFFSALTSLALAFYLLDFKLKRLEYLTFASQPVGLHREEEIG